MKKIYTLFIALFIGVFVLNTKLLAFTYYSLAAGALNNLSTWGMNPDGSGTHPTSFTDVVAHMFIISNRATATHSVTWNLNSNQTVVVGNGVNPINVTISGGLGKISTAKIQVASSGTLTLSKNGALPSSNFIILDNTSTVAYNAVGTQTIVDAGYGNLTIASTASLVTDGVFVNSILTINNGKTLDIKGHTFEIDGSIAASTGELITDNTSVLNIISSILGNIGTLRINGASPIINQLALGFIDPSGYVTLGNNLTIQGTSSYFFQQSGGIDLNGKTITIDPTSDANFPATNTDGAIRGSSTSSFLINGTIGVNGGGSAIFMDQTSSATKSLKVLSINNAGAALTIGNNLNIIDSLSVLAGSVDLGGFVTLKSTAAQKARLSRVGGTITGNMNVETYIPGGSAGWNTIGPAGVSGLTVSNWDGGSGSATGFAMTCSGCINDGNSAGGHFVSIQSDPAGNGVYTELTSASPLSPGTGYWAYIGNSLTTAIDIIQTTSGSAVTGNVTSGTGFISNPYASPLSFTSLQISNPGLTSLDVYDPNSATYKSYNGGIPSDFIPMGQGFYANAITTLTFHESNKTTSNNSMLKSSSANSTSIGSVFQLKIDGWYGDYDNTYVRFHNDATPAFDDLLDAYKRYATPGYLGYPGPYHQYTSIATVNTNQDYAINSLPYATTLDAVIPVIAKASATGQYTISPVDIQNLPPAACVILKDKLLNINHDLRTGSYVFNMSDTTSTPRFELTICADQNVTSIKQLTTNSNNVIIGQDGASGVFVKTNYDKNTKSVISAYNIMGQKIITDKEIEGSENLVYLDFKDLHNQIVIIKVSNDKGQTTKKVYLN